MLSLLWTNGKRRWLPLSPAVLCPEPIFPVTYLVIGLAWHQRCTIGENGSFLTVWGCPGHHDIGRNPCVMKEEANLTAKKLQAAS